MAKQKPAAKSTPVPVEAHKHVADSRKNIPTRELAEFAADDGIGKAVYHRDRSLDPQLVWKGKDDQDAKGALEVPALPIYVQEKVHPRRSRSCAGGTSRDDRTTPWPRGDRMRVGPTWCGRRWSSPGSRTPAKPGTRSRRPPTATRWR